MGSDKEESEEGFCFPFVLELINNPKLHAKVSVVCLFGSSHDYLEHFESRFLQICDLKMANLDASFVGKVTQYLYLSF